MNRTTLAQGGGPGGSPQRHPQISPLARDNTTAQQVGTLLAISSSVVAMLSSEIMENPPAEGGPRDGGVRSSLELVGINAAERLNDILEDRTRWTLESQSALEESLIAVHASQRALLDEQTNLSRISASPSSRFSPRINRLTNGKWAVFIGNFESAENRILGVGISPKEAMEDFDRVFLGKTEDQQNQALHETNVDRSRKPDSAPIIEVGEVPAGDGKTPPKSDGPTGAKQNVAPEKPKGQRHWNSPRKPRKPRA